MVSDAFTHYQTISTQAALSYRWYMGPGMMGFWGEPAGAGGWQAGFVIWSILTWITWILIIVALVAFIRWLWKKGDKP